MRVPSREKVPEGQTHLEDEGQHRDEGAGALGQQRQGTDAVHAQGVEPRRWHQPGQQKQNQNSSQEAKFTEELHLQGHRTLLKESAQKSELLEPPHSWK